MCLDHCTDYNTEWAGNEKLKPTKDDWNHGTLLILEELLRFSNSDIEVQKYHLTIPVWFCKVVHLP